MARIEATCISVFVRISAATFSTLISNSASHVGEVAVAPVQLAALTFFSVMDLIETVVDLLRYQTA